jgi:hypothetical protein
MLRRGKSITDLSEKIVARMFSFADPDILKKKPNL